MRVSVVSFCSTAVDMLDFSTGMLREHAGTVDYDYVLVTWNASPEVEAWIATHSFLKRFKYDTRPELAYVPNLRAMMNAGFDAAYSLNDYACIVNADMAFGRDWLINLVRRASEGQIPNSLHLSPITGPNIVTADFGRPAAGTFDETRFWELHDQLRRDRVETEGERGGWEATNTMPYVINRKWWNLCGPWRPMHIRGHEPPDRQFFRRCHEAGARFLMCCDSVCYHGAAMERRGRRPPGVEHMPEGV